MKKIKKIVKVKEVTITNENSFGKEEIYCEWFICPECGDIHIKKEYKFCPDCGVKLAFDIKKNCKMFFV